MTSTRFRLVLMALAAASLACQTVMGPWTPTPVPPLAQPVVAATPTLKPAPPEATAPAAQATAPAETAAPGQPTQPLPTTVVDANGLRTCAYAPGAPVAQMPPEVVNPPTATPEPTPAPLPITKVDAATTARQLRVFDKFWQTVNDVYPYRDFRGHDWKAIGDKYRAMVKAGVSDDDFYHAMNLMFAELGDRHSFFISPAEAKQQDAQLAGQNDFVGIGAMVEHADSVIIDVFPNSPAAQAGLRPHDRILNVDGGPVWDATTGQSRTLGKEGTPVTVTIQRPGETPRDLTIIRRHVTGGEPVEYCLIPSVRIGYLFIPTFFDDTIMDQVREAMKRLTAGGPLHGLVIDNRMNGGGISTQAEPFMSLFASDVQGYYVSPQGRRPLKLTGEDIGGSQTVPLVVLVENQTASYGEIVSGILRVAGRAKLIGENTVGVVDVKHVFDFEDGSRAEIVVQTFQPRGLANGVWEDVGVTPDVRLPTRWDLFNEANDPALAAAVDLLLKP